MSSAFIITGNVMHQRQRPVLHRFVYPVFCLRLNLDHLDQLQSFWLGINRWRPLSLRTQDYGPRDGRHLASWMRELLREHGLPDDGEIWLQTFPRVLGYAFNPVSFWLCHNREGALCAVLADVNNTFGEHHCYLISQHGTPLEQDREFVCDKRLHVSPFCQVEGHYRFRFQLQPGRTRINIDYYDRQGLLIQTAISGKLGPLTGSTASLVLLRQPLLTMGIISRIHWQALLLWLKKVPFFKKPAATATPFSRNKE